jgi:tricorn protease
MKKLLLSAFALCFAGTIAAQEAPLWMRYCALSPDGTTIAFTYKGDIYTVPSTGGRATQITTNPAFDTTPVWSPELLHPTAWGVLMFSLSPKREESPND